jgi:hypothetical protein
METKKPKDRTFFINRSKLAFARNEVTVKESELTIDDKTYLYTKLVESFNGFPADVQFAFAHNLSMKYMQDMAEMEAKREQEKLLNNETKDTDTQGTVLSEDIVPVTTSDEVN